MRRANENCGLARQIWKRPCARDSRLSIPQQMLHRFALLDQFLQSDLQLVLTKSVEAQPFHHGVIAVPRAATGIPVDQPRGDSIFSA